MVAVPDLRPRRVALTSGARCKALIQRKADSSEGPDASVMIDRILHMVVRLRMAPTVLAFIALCTMRRFSRTVSLAQRPAG